MEDLDYNNTVVQNETIEFKGKMDGYIGNKTEIYDCTIIISIPTKRFLVGETTISNSKIILKKPLINMRWFMAKFNECSFEGHFCGNDFGDWIEKFDVQGSVSNCNFKNANLDGCRFMNVDVTTIIFPKLPCFTLINPVQNIDKILHLHPYFQYLKNMYVGWLPPFTSAISYNIETQKEYIDDIDEFVKIIKLIEFIV